MLPTFIKSADDLITSHQATRDGFLLQAFTKTEKATPYVKEAYRFWEELKGIDDIKSLVTFRNIRNDLLAAAGFSDKAQAQLSDTELKNSLSKVIDTIEKNNRHDWKEEILYRYLLTKGDSLGGSMRNITGALAGIQFSNAILRELAESGISSNIRRSSNNPEKIQSIEWDNHFLLFDKTPKFIKKNIDVILLKSKMEHTSMKELLSVQKNYVALGELKGGIDPAGADEHWKTANSALERIRQSFKTQSPALFFVGAAIEADMAQEIFAQLKDGRLTSAANLTSHKQLADLATWLVHL